MTVALKQQDLDRIVPALRGSLRLAEPMARHSSWRCGGKADAYYRPADLDDLVTFLGLLPEGESLYWVGLGSNLLVRDGGLRATVVNTAPGLNGIDCLEGNRLRAEAGAASAKVARVAARAGLLGAEFLAGIPGSFGGALAMNAGAYGGETWNHVVEVETIDRHGQLHRRTPQDFSVGYRSVSGPDEEWFVAGTLALEPGDPEAGRARIKELLEQRGRSQPIGLANAGSVFRNPPGDHAARLIDTAGLKGHCVGGACVSQLHANFIINNGSATAADIETLIGELQGAVERRHGIHLEPEVRIVGDAP